MPTIFRPTIFLPISENARKFDRAKISTNNKLFPFVSGNVNEMGCAFAASQETHCHACAVKCIEETYEMKYTRLGFGNDKMLKTLLNVSGFEDKTPQGEYLGVEIRYF